MFIVFQKFTTAGNYYGPKMNSLNGGVVAQFVRFYPEEWQLSPCMRVEIYGEPANPFPGNVYNFKILNFIRLP